MDTFVKILLICMFLMNSVLFAAGGFLYYKVDKQIERVKDLTTELKNVTQNLDEWVKPFWKKEFEEQEWEQIRYVNTYDRLTKLPLN